MRGDGGESVGSQIERVVTTATVVMVMVGSGGGEGSGERSSDR